MPTSLTQELGRFVAGVSFRQLPSRAVEVARVGFIDCIATMIAGAGEPAPQLLRKTLHETFRGCLETGHSRITPEVLFDRLRRLEDLSARQLTAV